MGIEMSALSSVRLVVFNEHTRMSAMLIFLTCCQGYKMNSSSEVTYDSGLKSRGVTIQSGIAVWDNPVDPISKELKNKIALVIGLFLIPLLTLLGVPGNIVSAVVFYRQGLRERINLCLFALAIVDLVVVLDLFLPYFESQIRVLFLPHAWFFAPKCPSLIGFAWASNFLSAVIASERCFCVVSPFHAKRLLKTSTMAAIIVVCCLILIGGMAAIAGPKHTVIDIVDPATNTSKEIFYVTRYYLENRRILDIIDIFVYATCLPGLFLLIIVVTTVITIITLRSASSQRQSMTRASDGKLEHSKSSVSLSSREIAVTRMLIGTSLLFIVCLTPNFVGQVTTFFIPDLSLNGKYYNSYLVMWQAILLLRVVDSSVNVCVYYALGSKFRQSLGEILCCCTGQSLKSQCDSNDVHTESTTVKYTGLHSSLH